MRAVLLWLAVLACLYAADHPDGDRRFTYECAECGLVAVVCPSCWECGECCTGCTD